MSAEKIIIPPPPPTTDWTVMVFLNADNNLEPFSLRDFAEMARVGSTDKVNIVVQFDRIHQFTPQPPKTNCLRFRVKKGMTPTPANAVENLGAANMGDGVVLRDFVRWAMKKYPAKRYMLDIWDHGQGWRMEEARFVEGDEAEVVAYREFREESYLHAARLRAANGDEAVAVELEAVDPAMLEVEGISPSRVIDGPVRYCSHDETSKDKLFNREIQDSLTQAMNGRKIDLIGFDACLMSMVETAYAMRNVGKVMVGSEELEPGDGWDYADWLAKLVAKPDMDAAELGRVMVESYRKAYLNKDNAVTLSAVDLARLPDIVVALDKLADLLIKRLPAELSEIVQARDYCKPFAPGYGLHGIDLIRFSGALSGVSTDPAVKTQAANVHRATKQAVIANYAGPERLDGFGAQGLAIYFPARRALFNTDPDHNGYLKANNVYPVEFVQTHHWANFLEAYFKLVP